MQTIQKIGTYEILEELGKGGMGVVYKARHAESGQIVALKTVLAAREGLLSGLRREIHALAQIRHPGIVRIVDEGMEGGLPWYAMEFVRGKTLRAYTVGILSKTREPQKTHQAAPHLQMTETEDAKTKSETRINIFQEEITAEFQDLQTETQGRSQPRFMLDVRILEVMRQICEALAFLHGEGLVHRDLKPENVLVCDDGRAVLMDFGLASRFGSAGLGRETLEIAGGVAGTVAYMSPEQARGEFVDARADLYSFGCILYELATGTVPFVGQNILEVLQQHLHATPVPPSKRLPGVLPGMDALVLALLAKTPRDRLGYADDAAAQLAKMGAAKPLQAGPKPRAYLYRPRMAGRESEFSTLRHRTKQLLEKDQGGLLLVSGESGSGKTRLLLELARSLPGGALVLAGAANATAFGDVKPLQALQEPLRAMVDRCRTAGIAETGRLFGLRGKALEPYEPTLADLPGQSAYPPAPVLQPEAARIRLWTYLNQTFQALAEDKPILLILDDLQDADSLTLGWLEFFLRSVRATKKPAPILILGAYRAEEQPEAISGLLALQGAESLVLGKVDETAVSLMIADMLALPRPPLAFAQFITERASGNPFFISEYLRAAVQGGLICRDSRGRWRIAELLADYLRTAVEDKLLFRDSQGGWLMAQPEDPDAALKNFSRLPLLQTLHDVVSQRLKDLSSETLSLAQAAAVLGLEVDEPILQEMLHLDQSAYWDAVQELLRRHILEEAGETLRFTHEKLRDAAYHLLPSAEKTRLHHMAAMAIMQSQENMTGWKGNMATLGRHWEHAGQPEKAKTCYLEAARIAISRYDLTEAARLYQAYLRLSHAPTQESLAAKNELAQKVLEPQGKNAEALVLHHQVLQEAIQLQDQALQGTGLLGLGGVYESMGDPQKAEALYKQALAIYRETKDRQNEGAALTRLAILRQEQGNATEASRLYEEALSLRSLGMERRIEGIVLGNFANLLSYQGRMEEARQFYEQALAIHREVGNRPHEAYTLGNFAALEREAGNLEAAQMLWQALSIAREVGHRPYEGVVLGNLAILQSDLGHTEESGKLYEQAIAIALEVGDQRFEAIERSNLAELHHEQGQYTEARELYEKALFLHRKVGNLRFEAITLCALGNTELLSDGNWRMAQQLIEEGLQIHQASEDKFLLAKALCWQGHARLAAGQNASDSLQQAQLLATELKIAPNSDLGKLLSRLQRAQKAFVSGEQHLLHRGILIQDLTEGQKRSLRETGQNVRE